VVAVHRFECTFVETRAFHEVSHSVYNVISDFQTFGGGPSRYLAQPSKVKVTHVYNQSVWAPGSSPDIGSVEALPHSPVPTSQQVACTDVNTLRQVKLFFC